jgi:PPOX class probable F420-dependent enzyme
MPTQPSQQPALPDEARALLDRPEHAVIATVEPSGQPQLSVVWVTRDGDDVLLSTVRGRYKTDNLERDPRASLLVYPADDPYSYVEVRGRATLEDDPEQELIEVLSMKYLGKAYPWRNEEEKRVVVRLTPSKVVWHG